MVLLTKLRVLAIKKEAALGTGIATAAGDAYFPAWDISISPAINMIDRPSPGSASMFASVPGTRMGVARFKTYLYGGGTFSTSPLWAELLFPACSYAQTTDTFSPSTAAPSVSATAPTTVTISSYENGKQKTICGAMGKWKMNFKNGEPVVIDWEFSGAWEGVAGAAPEVDAAILAPTYNTTIPWRFAGTTMTIGGAAPGCIDEMTIDSGNNVVVRPCATDSTGFQYAIVPTRKVIGSWNPESRLVATEDVHALWLAGTEQALSIELTDGVDKVTIAAPKVQRINIQPGDRDGIQIDQIDFQMNKSAAAGDDEITITFAAA